MTQCPFCGNKGVGIIQFPDQADQFHCPICGCSFELESQGSRVRICTTPERFPLDASVLSERWLSMPDLRQLIQQLSAEIEVTAAEALPSVPRMPTEAVETIPQPAVDQLAEAEIISIAASSEPVSVSAPPFIDESAPVKSGIAAETVRTDNPAVFTAVGLAELGNTTRSIQSVLERSGATSEQIQIALARAREEKQKKRSSVRLNPIVVIGIAMGIILIMALATFILVGNQAGPPRVTPTPVSFIQLANPFHS
jgi:hypothetical protein